MNKSKIFFINVDAEIRANFDLKPALEKLGSKVTKMYCDEYGEGKFLLALELAVEDRESTPDRMVRRFCKLFKKYIKEEVSKAESIVFDIGYESGEKPNCLRNVISSKTLKKVWKKQ